MKTITCSNGARLGAVTTGIKVEELK